MGRLGSWHHCVMDEIDCQTGKSEAGDGEKEQRGLQQKRPQAAGAITPGDLPQALEDGGGC
jgi:hypothetical protein